MFTGDIIDADEALRIGLVSRRGAARPADAHGDGAGGQDRRQPAAGRATAEGRPAPGARPGLARARRVGVVVARRVVPDRGSSRRARGRSSRSGRPCSEAADAAMRSPARRGCRRMPSPLGLEADPRAARRCRGPFPADVLAVGRGRAADVRRATSPRRPHRRPSSSRSTPVDQHRSRPGVRDRARPAAIDLLLRYAIADVGWFVHAGRARRRRGVAARRHDVPARRRASRCTRRCCRRPRPACCPTVPDRRSCSSCASMSTARRVLDGVERAVIRSRAKLAYEHGSAATCPAASTSSRRASDSRRTPWRQPGRSPEQEVEPRRPGGYRSRFEPRLANEDTNAGMSLATNLAVADALLAAEHRPVPGDGRSPTSDAADRLRHRPRRSASTGRRTVDLADVPALIADERPRRARGVHARRATGDAAARSYAPFAPGAPPWHSAMAATYCHADGAAAPTRRSLRRSRPRSRWPTAAPSPTQRRAL